MTVFSSITEIIGNTPLLQLDPEKTGLKNIDIYAKLEYMNPFGSIKDRTAWGMLRKGIGEVQKNKQEYIEASSGNTIKAMQAMAGIRDITCTSVTNRIRVQELKDILLVLGANVVEVPGKSSCIDPTNPEDPLYIIQNKMQEQPNRFVYPNQYYNEDNPRIHSETTGEEIIRDLQHVDFLVSSLGTTGSSQGISRKLKEANTNLQNIGVAAVRDDFIPGIRNENDLMDVGIYDRSIYNDVLYLSSSSAIDGMIQLIKAFGILAGPTSGAVYSAALQVLKKEDENTTQRKKAVIVMCDRMEWYISYLKERRPEIFRLAPKKNSINEYIAQYEDIHSIEIQEAEAWIESNKTLIIDMRSNLAYRTGHIFESINITDTFLEELIDDRLPFPKHRKLLFCCASGRVSERIAAYLCTQGYDAYSLKSGIAGWRDAGLAFERIPLQTHDQ